MSSEKQVDIKEWIEECINGHAGYKSFIGHENLGVYSDDLALAGATWIIRCLAQPHAKDVLDAVNRQAARNIPPNPLQPGDRVLVEAEVVSVDPNAQGLMPEIMTLRIHGIRSWTGKDLFGFYDLSAIHPTKKGE